MNEDIAQALLAIEARTIQAEQRLADLEFQLRQVHRDLDRVLEIVGRNNADIAELLMRSNATRVNSRLESVGSIAWPGRLKLN